MKVRVLSDLHLEFNPLDLPQVDADLVVLAGDIAPLACCNAAQWARQHFMETPIVWILGNHEFYDSRDGLDRCVDHARALASEFDVAVLEQDVFVQNEVRVLGCTLWTDFRLQGVPEISVLRARLGMSDFSGRIWKADAEGTRFLRPADTIEIHRRSVAWLEAELSKPFAGPTCVVTHHAPHPQCESSAHAGDLLAPAFCSDLSATIDRHQPALWISGHTHANHDLTIGHTRLVSNQRGYQDDARGLATSFKPTLVVEI